MITAAMQLPAKTLKFPESFSVGRLYISDNYVRERYVGEARGTVNVAANRKVKLSFYPNAVFHLEKALQQLEPADIDYLSLEQTQVTDRDIEPLFRLTGIQKLYLQFTKLDGSSFDHLKEFQQLQSVSAWWTRMRDIGLQSLSQLQSLETLDISRTQITDEGVCALVRARALQTLVLRDNRVTDMSVNQLAALPALQHLSLAGTDLTDESIGVLARMQALLTLDISKTRITLDGALQLRSSLPNCKIDYDQDFAASQLTQFSVPIA